jgi:hypothetical protein
MIVHVRGDQILQVGVLEPPMHAHKEARRGMLHQSFRQTGQGGTVSVHVHLSYLFVSRAGGVWETSHPLTAQTSIIQNAAPSSRQISWWGALRFLGIHVPVLQLFSLPRKISECQSSFFLKGHNAPTGKPT